MVNYPELTIFPRGTIVRRLIKTPELDIASTLCCNIPKVFLSNSTEVVIDHRTYKVYHTGVVVSDIDEPWRIIHYNNTIDKKLAKVEQSTTLNMFLHNHEETPVEDLEFGVFAPMINMNIDKRFTADMAEYYYGEGYSDREYNSTDFNCHTFCWNCIQGNKPPQSYISEQVRDVSGIILGTIGLLLAIRCSCNIL